MKIEKYNNMQIKILNNKLDLLIFEITFTQYVGNRTSKKVNEYKWNLNNRAMQSFEYIFVIQIYFACKLPN